MPTNKTIKNYTIIGVVLLVYLTLIIGLLVWLFNGSAEKSSDFMLQSPVIIIIAIVISVLTFTVASAVFAAIGKSKDTTALGMPEGSIRALIALSLIALFFILATQMYSKVSANGIGKIDRVTEESLKDIAIKDIILKNKIDSLPNKAFPTDTTASRYLYIYDVSVKVPVNSDAGDMAKSIIASFTALIAAISGFYFGSGASKQNTSTSNPTPPNAVISLKSPIPAPTNGIIGHAIILEWDVTPVGEAIVVQVIGDIAQPTLVDAANPLRYTYTPNSIGQKTLKIYLKNNPSVFKEYIITVAEN